MAGWEKNKMFEVKQDIKNIAPPLALQFIRTLLFYLF